MWSYILGFSLIFAGFFMIYFACDVFMNFLLLIYHAFFKPRKS